MFSKPFVNLNTGKPSKYSSVLAKCHKSGLRSSSWTNVPRDRIDYDKVYRWCHYITKHNFEKWKLRDSKLTYVRCLRQATEAFFGEMMTWYFLDNGDNSLLPDWYVTPDVLWDNLRVSWQADHVSSCNTAIEDKTKHWKDPGIVLQYSSSDRTTRPSANRHPILTGAVGPNYFLNILEHRNIHGNHQYRIAAVVRGIDVYQNRDFEYNGRKLIGKMENGNQHKKQLTLEVLYNCPGITFYCPVRVQPQRVRFGKTTTVEIPTERNGIRFKFSMMKLVEESPPMQFGCSSP